MIDRAFIPLARERVAWWRRGRGGPAADAPEKGWTRLLAETYTWWLPTLIGFALGRAAVVGVLVPFGCGVCAAWAALGRAWGAAAGAVAAACGGWAVSASDDGWA